MVTCGICFAFNSIIANIITPVRGDRISRISTPLHPSSKRAAEDEEDDQTPGQSARARNHKKLKQDPSVNGSQQRLILKTKMEQTPDTASPAPPGSGHPILNQFEPPTSQPTTTAAAAATTTTTTTTSRRPRPLTQHQLAVEQNRRERVEYILAKRKNEMYTVFRAKRESEIPFARYGRLLQSLPEGYDTEDEEHSWGKGGLIPNPEEEEDFGECANYFLSVIRKATRRLDRWDYENANGPKRDRKKEREERAQAKQQNGLNAGGNNNKDSNNTTVDAGGARATPSSRSKAKAPPRSSAKRKSTAGGTTTATPNKKQASSSSRSKSSRSRAAARGGPAAADTADSTKDALEAPSRSPLPPSTRGDADMDIDGDDVLDDIDKELLGEATGDEDDDHQHLPPPRRANSNSHAHPSNSRASRPILPEEPGFDDSFLADDDNEPLTSENEDELASDLDMEEGLSGYGGRNYASSLSSSPVGDIEGEVGHDAEAEALADDDDLM